MAVCTFCPSYYSRNIAGSSFVNFFHIASKVEHEGFYRASVRLVQWEMTGGGFVLHGDCWSVERPGSEVSAASWKQFLQAAHLLTEQDSQKFLLPPFESTILLIARSALYHVDVAPYHDQCRFRVGHHCSDKRVASHNYLHPSLRVS